MEKGKIIRTHKERERGSRSSSEENPDARDDKDYAWQEVKKKNQGRQKNSASVRMTSSFIEFDVAMSSLVWTWVDFPWRNNTQPSDAANSFPL